MAKKICISGQRYGRLIAIKAAGYIQFPSRKSITWECLCDCGGVVTATLSSLRSGNVSSCGCIIKEGSNRRTHGMSKTSEYHSWASMVSRCRAETNQDYPSYGGRGITVCDEWICSFERFIADMGMKPTPRHSIDRIDNSKGYFLDNCRWATPTQQSRNRRNNKVIEFNSETKTASEWANDLGISFSTLMERLEKWPVDIALTKPKRKVGTKN